MTDFNKEFNNLFNSLLNNPDIIKEAEESIEEEVRAYRAKKQAEFESSAVFKRAKAAAIQQLKEKKLNEAKTAIDSEFKAKSSQFESFLSSGSSFNSSSSSNSNEDKTPLTKEERSRIMKEAWAKKSDEEKAAISKKQKEAWAKKSDEEKKAISEKRKKTTARKKAIKAMNADLDSAAISLIFDNVSDYYSSDDVQEVVREFGADNAAELSHEQIQELLASLINDGYLDEGHARDSLMRNTNQLYKEEFIDGYVSNALKDNPNATLENSSISSRTQEERGNLIEFDEF